MEIIEQRERVIETCRSLDFYKDDEICAGYDTEDGVTPIFQVPEAEKIWNSLLEQVKNGELTGPVVNEFQRIYTKPAVGRCECGAEVELRNQYMGACECSGCGRWYNLFGQELLPPEQWEQ